MVQGLSHMTFIVSDLDKMEEILTTVLDAKKTYDSGDKRVSINAAVDQAAFSASPSRSSMSIMS